ncbi:MAG: tetratricopeptide repeat protein [Armatimonadota bacterium]|nr:tetratricopeptide repeat protein [Armatimonadota bacterium]
MIQFRKVVHCVLLIGSAFAVLAAGPCGAATAEELLAAGHEAVARGDLAAAKNLFGQCISQYPQTLQAAEASWKLGFIAIKEGDLPLAEQRFSWVVDNHPSSPRAPDSLLRLAYLAKKSWAGRRSGLVPPGYVSLPGYTRGGASQVQSSPTSDRHWRTGLGMRELQGCQGES